MRPFQGKVVRWCRILSINSTRHRVAPSKQRRANKLVEDYMATQCSTVPGQCSNSAPDSTRAPKPCKYCGYGHRSGKGINKKPRIQHFYRFALLLPESPVFSMFLTSEHCFEHCQSTVRALWSTVYFPRSIPCHLTAKYSKHQQRIANNKRSSKQVASASK